MAYFSSFLVAVSKGNLSLQYVKSQYRLEFGENGGLDVGVAPRVHSISCGALATWEVARAGEEP